MISRLLHRSPHLRGRAVDRDYARRRDRDGIAAVVAISRHHAPHGPGFGHLPRRERPGRGRHGRRADRTASQRRRGNALHEQPVGQRRLVQPDRDLRPGHQSEHGPGDGAKPRFAGHAATAQRRAAARPYDQEEIAQHPAGRELLLAGRPLRQYLPEQLRHDLYQGRAVPAGRRGRHQLPGRARL